MINYKISILKWLDYFAKLKLINIIKLILALFFKKKVKFKPQIIETKNGTYICETLDSFLISNKYFEYSLQKTIHKIIKELNSLNKLNNGIDLLNIGAHLGRYSIQYSNYFKNVYAFEPTPKTFKYLSANIELSKKENIKIYNMGLGNEKMKINFEINKNAESQNKIVKEENKNTIKIDIDKFDNLDINKENIKIILIDVEGHEEEVINGMYNFIKNNNNLYLIIEILNKEKLKKMSLLLKDFNYKKIDPINYLFIKK